MLLFIALALVLVAVLAWSMRGPGRWNAANLGWMSEQWLAEYHATHPS